MFGTARVTLGGTLGGTLLGGDTVHSPLSLGKQFQKYSESVMLPAIAGKPLFCPEIQLVAVSQCKVWSVLKTSRKLLIYADSANGHPLFQNSETK